MEKPEFKFLKHFGQKQNQGMLLINGTIQKRQQHVYSVAAQDTKIQITKLMFIQYRVYFLEQTNCHVHSEIIISLP